MLTAGLSITAATVVRSALLRNRSPLSPATSPTELWKTFRWSIDPQRRREAALLMASTSPVQAAQGWGDDPLAAVALGLAADAAGKQGDIHRAETLWRQLLERFPDQPISARARQRFPEHHQELLQRQPAHPAALATAVALEADDVPGHRGAIHLSRWGWRWPGAQARLREACAASGPTPAERQQLAWALAMLGDGDQALACVQGRPERQDAMLAVGRVLLQGRSDQQEQGQQLLLDLIQKHPNSPDSLEAVRLLMAPLFPNPALIDAIPAQLADASAAVAAARVRLNGGAGAIAVLKRWPHDRDSWQLQWDVARDALLRQDWERASQLLGALPPGSLPGPLEARRLFWLALSHERSGDPAAARKHWTHLIRSQPAGYYRWRAQMRVYGEQPLPLSPQPTSAPPPAWTPLNSRDDAVNTLWRLGLYELAWDTWLAGQQPDKPLPETEQLVAGRLRLQVGDPWRGLDQLWRLSVRWASPSCSARRTLQQSQSPVLFAQEMQMASTEQDVRQELLLAIAKQESRFSPAVRSVAGAVGLMQLMPATAASLMDRPLEEGDLEQPALNVSLGAAYVRELLDLWDNDLFRSIASYNAGPGAVASWPKPEGNDDLELWVERIPYPETRYYTKKVLDNLLSYSDPTVRFCEEAGRGMGQLMPESDPNKQNGAQQQHGEPRGGNDANPDEIQSGQEQR